MNENHRMVWITRPHPAGLATQVALLRHGQWALSIPLLAVNLLPDARLPQAPPDWILFVSGNAVRGLDAALGADRATIGTPRVAAVGARTAAAARDAGWEVNLVARPENAEGLLAALHDVGRAGRRFWIPCGNREGSARDLLPTRLAADGAHVECIPVYETTDRVLGAPEAAALAGEPPFVILLHSTSAVEALYRPDQPEPVRRWRDRARFLCIGDRTMEAVGERGRGRATACEEPSDEAVARAVSAMPSAP